MRTTAVLLVFKLYKYAMFSFAMTSGLASDSDKFKTTITLGRVQKFENMGLNKNFVFCITHLIVPEFFAILAKIYCPRVLMTLCTNGLTTSIQVFLGFVLSTCIYMYFLTQSSFFPSPYDQTTSTCFSSEHFQLPLCPSYLSILLFLQIHVSIYMQIQTQLT